MQVTIRPLQLADADTSVQWRNIPDIWVHTTFKATREITIDDERSWVQKVTNDPTSRRFAIIADGTYVGNIYLTDIQDLTAEYHIFIGDRAYWGKGVARKASVEILNHAKNVLKLHRILLNVKEDNTAAFHLYSSLGFKKTGKLDGEFVQMELPIQYWNGDPRDKMN